MSMEEIMEKLNPLWEDEQFVAALAGAETDEEVLKLLGEHGIELNEEEAAEIKAAANRQGELSEDDLEDVAGGIGFAGMSLAVAIALGLYRLWKAWKNKHR